MDLVECFCLHWEFWCIYSTHNMLPGSVECLHFIFIIEATHDIELEYCNQVGLWASGTPNTLQQKIPALKLVLSWFSLCVRCDTIPIFHPWISANTDPISDRSELYILSWLILSCGAFEKFASRDITHRIIFRSSSIATSCVVAWTTVTSL